MIGILFAWLSAMALIGILLIAHQWTPRLLRSVAVSLMGWCSILAVIGITLRAGW